MDRKPLEQKTAVGKYDPTKNYVWNRDDIFSVTGAEIESWNNAIGVYVNTPEYQRFMQLQKAALLMQDFIKQSVEQGLIKEQTPDLTVVKKDDGLAE